uniref:Uncharacterized protein n=1 Tax=Nelumbo nucifera TaxID=4432 RepID=A0A822ZE96_NELNU|nr:TPA_asm: hypothetical protein HUJ06_014241 [Nelumbo nucifera]
MASFCSKFVYILCSSTHHGLQLHDKPIHDHFKYEKDTNHKSEKQVAQQDAPAYNHHHSSQ